MKIVPNMYKKNILDINYNKLKELGYKCLIFDLDNTICVNRNNNIEKEIISLFKTLKKDFNVIMLTNSIKIKRIKEISEKLDIPYYYMSLKPSSRNYKKILKKYDYETKDLVAIGDQLLTDILGAKKLGIFSILVDPLEKHENLFTKTNRIIEKRILNKNKVEKGEYYE